MPKKKVRKSRALIQGYLEKISSKIFSDYRKQLTGLVGRQHGVYALYKGQRLYYVGLATDLRGRVNQHLKDKHAGRWDKFSLYLVRKVDHIKELEAIMMRVANPAGNTSHGRLPRAENMLNTLKQEIRNEQKRQMDSLLGNKGKAVVTKSRSATRSSKTAIKKSDRTRGPFPLAKRIRVRGAYKGAAYEAMLLKNGSVRFKGKLYGSVSSAASAIITSRAVNGWMFWKYRDPIGEWIAIDKLRNKT
jgi:hypothetical protein